MDSKVRPKDCWPRGSLSVNFSAPFSLLTLPHPHPRAISQPRAGSFHRQCGRGLEADGRCWLMGAAEREGAEWGPRLVASGPQDPGRSSCAGPGRSRKGPLRPRAGAGNRSLRPGKHGPRGRASACAAALRGSRPWCRGRATQQGCVLGLQPRVSLPTQGWPQGEMQPWRQPRPTRSRGAGRLGRGVEVGPERRPGLQRPALSPLSSPSLAQKACQPRPQPSPLSSPKAGSAFPPSTLGRIQSEKAPLSFCVCWGRCGRRRDRVTTFISWNVWGNIQGFYPPIRPGDGLGFQALSLSCHQTNEALRALERECYLLFMTPRAGDRSWEKQVELIIGLFSVSSPFWQTCPQCETCQKTN